ncbi:putative multi-domain containing protein [Aduncisulcus paluster]|uniref:Multi-domain containing protein n=1 Tax=Aduncisulcus paluster TaxID=2918883 RepID=A0ABQ5K565_9EUKA|nr:putative multi-domain containing protein [Aduncisulcus paluster]
MSYSSPSPASPGSRSLRPEMLTTTTSSPSIDRLSSITDRLAQFQQSVETEMMQKQSQESKKLDIVREAITHLNKVITLESKRRQDMVKKLQLSLQKDIDESIDGIETEITDLMKKFLPRLDELEKHMDDLGRKLKTEDETRQHHSGEQRAGIEKEISTLHDELEMEKESRKSVYDQMDTRLVKEIGLLREKVDTETASRDSGITKLTDDIDAASTSRNEEIQKRHEHLTRMVTELKGNLDQESAIREKAEEQICTSIEQIMESLSGGIMAVNVDVNQVIVSMFGLAFLLLGSKILRMNVKFFQVIHLPTSVVAGLIGLLIVQLISISSTAGDWLYNTLHLDVWEGLPTILICFIFAGLFSGERIPPFKKIIEISASQLVYGLLVGFGQYVVGVGLGGLVRLIPKYSDLPPYFGCIVPIGFEGGHGTAAGMADTFDSLGWPQGKDFALAAATIGIIGAIVMGYIFIGIANKKHLIGDSIACIKSDDGLYVKSWREKKSETKYQKHADGDSELMGLTDALGDDEVHDSAIIEGDKQSSESDQPPHVHKRDPSVHSNYGTSEPEAGLAKASQLAQSHASDDSSLDSDAHSSSLPIGARLTIKPDSMDTMTFVIGILTCGCFIGYLIKCVLCVIESTSATMTKYHFFSSFPLFPLAMIGGLLIQIIMGKCESDDIVDRGSVERIMALSNDFLISAVVSTINISSIADDVLPFVVVICGGLAWHVCCLWLIAPSICPDYWFVRALTEMGHSCGVAATGLMLLKSVDPMNTTPVLKAFSLAQIIHEVIMGGGIWTSIAVPLCDMIGPWWFTLLAFAIMMGLLTVWATLLRPSYIRNGVGRYKDHPQHLAMKMNNGDSLLVAASEEDRKSIDDSEFVGTTASAYPLEATDA